MHSLQLSQYYAAGFNSDSNDDRSLGEAFCCNDWVVITGEARQVGRNGQVSRGEVARVAACRLQTKAKRWRYADEHGVEITAAWQDSVAANPRFFNGAIQVLTHHEIIAATFTGTFATTDFASFVHWRAHGYADDTVRDCFGCAIIRSAEGHLLLGLQAAGNLNSGRAYCPGGFIDPVDVGLDGMIDIDRSVGRELREETGLDLSQLVRVPGYLIAAASSSIAIGIEYRSGLTANALRASILRHLLGETNAELADIVIVRSLADLAKTKTSAYVSVLATALFDDVKSST